MLALLGCAAPELKKEDPAPRASSSSSQDDVALAPKVSPSRKSRVKQILPHNVRVHVFEGDTNKRTASGALPVSR